MCSVGLRVAPRSPNKRARPTAGGFPTSGRHARHGAGPELPLQRGPVQVASDENQPVRARPVAPRAAPLAVEQHVHALEHVALVLARDVQEALHAEDVGPLRLQKPAQPRVDALAVDRAAELDADRRHGVVVLVARRKLHFGRRGQGDPAGAEDLHRELLGQVLRKIA